MLELGFEKHRFQANLNCKFNAKKHLKDYNLIEGIDNIEQTPFDTETNSYYGNPSSNIFNFNVNYKFNNRLTCYINIDNIFDIHFKEFASAISAPGRNFSLSILIE
jgi:hemoglobin/transferrin/lactoferrin receptor protein